MRSGCQRWAPGCNPGFLGSHSAGSPSPHSRSPRCIRAQGVLEDTSLLQGSLWVCCGMLGWTKHGPRKAPTLGVSTKLEGGRPDWVAQGRFLSSLGFSFLTCRLKALAGIYTPCLEGLWGIHRGTVWTLSPFWPLPGELHARVTLSGNGAQGGETLSGRK